MSKCQTCRKADVLDSRWDKIRLYLFHFFHNDIIDLSQDKFTQGFADGYKKGREDEKEISMQMMKEFMSEPIEITKLPMPIIDVEKVITEKNGKIYLNQVLIDPKKLADLKQEVHLIRNTSLWDLLTNTLFDQAFTAGWNKSKNWEDLLTGKTITYTIDVQQKIIEKIEKAL